MLRSFDPKEIRHIVREVNAVADCLSRLEMEHRDFDLIEAEVPSTKTEQLNSPKDSLKDTVDEMPFPQAPKLFSKVQQQEREL